MSLDEVNDDDLSEHLLAQKHNCKDGEVWDKTLKRCVPKGVPTNPVPEPNPVSRPSAASSIPVNKSATDGNTTVTLTGTLNISTNAPTPTPIPPSPTPEPPTPSPPTPTTGNIGPDGVMQIFPTNGAELYLGDNPDKTKFNVSYGTGSHLPYTKKTEGALTFFNTTGNPISYHSGSKSGRSVRLDFYTDDSIWGDKTKYAWDNNNGYLLEPAPKCIENGEYTIYLRPHSPLGSQQSCAWKLGGRDEDSMRSLFEICAADAGTHKDPYAHWDYLHFPYIACPLKISPNHSKLTPEQWYGVKAVRIVDPSKKFCDFYLFEDPNPFDSNGKPQNNWRLIAHGHDAGCSGYKNIPCTWASQKDLMRVDGFQSVDFALGSVRRIDPTAKPAVPLAEHLQAMSIESVDPEDQSKWIENPFASVEEVQALRKSSASEPIDLVVSDGTNEGRLTGTLSIGGISPSPTPSPTPSPPSPSPSPSPAPTSGDINKEGVQVLAVRDGKFSYELADDPNKDAQLKLEALGGSTPKTEGSLKFHTVTGKVIHYASGQPDSKTVRFDMFPPNAKGQTQKHTWKDNPTFLWDASVPLDSAVIGFYRPHKGTGAHTSTSIKIRGGIHTGSHDPRSSDLEMDLPTVGGQARYARELNHPDYDYKNVDKQYFRNLGIEENIWYGLQLISYVNTDGKSTTNQLYVNRDPFNADGSIKNQNWKLFSEVRDVDGKSTGQYTKAPLWSAFVTTLRIDGWDIVDFAKLAWYGIQKPTGTPTPTPQPPSPTPQPPTPTPQPPSPTPTTLFGIIHGMMVDPSGNEQCNTSMIQTCKDLTPGKPIGVCYFTHHWASKVEPFPQAMCDAAKSKGCVPFIRMNAYELKSTTVTCQSILDGKHDSELQAYAQAAKAWGGTILAEMGTECNGNFLGFSGEGSAKYKQMIQKVIPMFKSIAPNVKWFFHGDYNDLSSHPEQWYPGDQYFDWIGTSMYGQSNGKGCVGSLGSGNPSPYDVMSTTGKKPLAILEWGLSDITDTTNTLKNIPTRFSKIKMMLYWNEKGSYNRLIQKTPEHLKAYQDNIQNNNYTSNYYNP